MRVTANYSTEIRCVYCAVIRHRETYYYYYLVIVVLCVFILERIAGVMSL